MTQKELIIMYLVAMTLLAGTWIYLQTQVTVTRTCYEYDKEIPCDLMEQKQNEFLPSIPENYTLKFPIPPIQ